jgi:hypothetical protein
LGDVIVICPPLAIDRDRLRRIVDAVHAELIGLPDHLPPDVAAHVRVDPHHAYTAVAPEGDV